MCEPGDASASRREMEAFIGHFFGDISNHIAEHHRLTKHKIHWDSADASLTVQTTSND